MEEQFSEIKSMIEVLVSSSATTQPGDADVPVPPEVSLVVGNVAPVDAVVCKKTLLFYAKLKQIYTNFVTCVLMNHLFSLTICTLAWFSLVGGHAPPPPPPPRSCVPTTTCGIHSNRNCVWNGMIVRKETACFLKCLSCTWRQWWMGTMPT